MTSRSVVKHFLDEKRNELRNLFEHFNVQFFPPTIEGYVREFMKVMKPISEALDALQADAKISMGYLLPTLTIFLRKMECLLKKGAIKHCKPLLSTLIESDRHRFTDCFHDENLYIAAMIHPLFKTKWINEDERASRIKRLIEVFNSFKNDLPDLNLR